MRPLVLASGSPRRRELLARCGVPFALEVTHAPELEEHPDGPEALVRENARLKGLAAARLRPDAFILASDTTVALGDTVFGKPADLAEATAMLRSLSGRRHTVFTALCWVGDSVTLDCESAEVTFHTLTDAVITDYFSRVNPLDKAGAYGIQSEGHRIIARLEGNLSTVMGLPLARVARHLRSLGYAVPDVSDDISVSEV